MPEKYAIIDGQRERIGIVRIEGCRPARTARIVVWRTQKEHNVLLTSIEYVFPPKTRR